ncbi:hypothetical protein BC829DRAFT_284700 [Chytridium lagenaria]|nr:hypothetical protein BC829DRAFT_284700 [Chytridium lagenaria]
MNDSRAELMMMDARIASPRFDTRLLDGRSPSDPRMGGSDMRHDVRLSDGMQDPRLANGLGWTQDQLMDNAAMRRKNLGDGIRDDFPRTPSPGYALKHRLLGEEERHIALRDQMRAELEAQLEHADDEERSRIAAVLTAALDPRDDLNASSIPVRSASTPPSMHFNYRLAERMVNERAAAGDPMYGNQHLLPDLAMQLRAMNLSEDDYEYQRLAALQQSAAGARLKKEMSGSDRYYSDLATSSRNQGFGGNSGSGPMGFSSGYTSPKPTRPAGDGYSVDKKDYYAWDARSQGGQGGISGGNRMFPGQSFNEFAGGDAAAAAAKRTGSPFYGR